jgi:competence protein ComFC
MKRNLEDLIYPSICELCESPLSQGRALCASCSAKLPRVSHPFCDVCGENFQGQIDGAFECPNCKDISFYFEFASAALDRSEKALELVHRLKYGHQIHLAKELGLLAVEALQDKRFTAAMEEGWPLVPVPLHPSRQMERFFNQAEELALFISKESGLPVMNLLKRVVRTITQTRLSRKERMDNLKNAFAIKKPWLFQNKRKPSDLPGVILVDDVFTTGSTVDACAKVLHKAGVKRIVVLTALRG